MLNESQTRSVALFFVLAFLDEALALKATLKVLNQCKRYKNREIPFSSPEALVVCLTRKLWTKLRGQITYSNYLPDRVWKLPQDLDIESWKQFVGCAQFVSFHSGVWVGGGMKRIGPARRDARVPSSKWTDSSCKRFSDVVLKTIRVRHYSCSTEKADVGCCRRARKARPRASPVDTVGGRNPEIVAAGEKTSKNHDAIDTREAQRV